MLGIILAVSRALIQEAGVAFEPEVALLEVVAHTHYLPRHWRGRAHTREVHHNFQALFPFKVPTPQIKQSFPMKCSRAASGRKDCHAAKEYSLSLCLVWSHASTMLT